MRAAVRWIATVVAAATHTPPHLWACTVDLGGDRDTVHLTMACVPRFRRWEPANIVCAVLCVVACTGMLGSRADQVDASRSLRTESGDGPPHAGLFDLPPLLQFSNGTAVRSPQAWQERRAEMRRLLAATLYGTAPETVPAIASVSVRNRTHQRGYQSFFADVTLATPPPAPRATFTVEMLVPDLSQGAPLPPLFMTQSNHRRWGLVGLSRGYTVCIYPGADSDDQTDPLLASYPTATWGLIRRRAWLGSRALDYVLSLGITNASQVAITGHSRNGKQSMIAAAWDERITAVISSSSGAPAMSPYRLTSSFTFSESPYGTWPNAPPDCNCSCTRNPTDPRPKDARCCWWLPSVVDWDGRENEMPIDSHALLGLIAPRHFASEAAWTDPCDPSFAVEKSYVAGKVVYDWLGASDNIRVAWRPGQHHGFEDPHQYFDWFDYAFDRPAAGSFPVSLLHNFTWSSWNETNGRTVPAQPSKSAPLLDKVSWAIGEGPAGPGWSPGGEYGLIDHAYIDAMLGLGDQQLSTGSDGVTKMAINFGRYYYGDIYFVNNSVPAEGLPVLVWLHPFSYQAGIVENYIRESEPFYVAAAKAGFLVLAFDQAGFATRLHEGVENFYRRYRDWSLLGQMVDDVSSALDAILSDQDGPHPSGLPLSDWYHGKKYPKARQDAVTVAGYALGGLVALHSAAFDDRITAVASIAGITPFRNDSMAQTIGGNRRLFELHGLLPRLGLYQGHEEDFPYDYDELLASVAKNKSVLIYAPELDRVANLAALSSTVEAARKTDPHGLPNLKFSVPSGAFNVLDSNATEAALSFLSSATRSS